MLEGDRILLRLSLILLVWLCLLPMGVRAQGHGTGGGHGTTPSGPVNSGPVNTGTPVTLPDPTFLPSNPTMRAGDEGKVEFKTETVLIQVPIVVVDQAGKHVLNLKKEDFELRENGKEQKVTTFEEVTANQLPLSAVKSRPGEFSNLAAAQGEQPRSIMVVVLDTVNTPMLDQTYARKQLLKFLAQNLDSNQVFGLVIITANGLKIVHGLTGDCKQVIDALNKVSSGLPAMTGVSLDTQVAVVSGTSPSGAGLSPDSPPLSAAIGVINGDLQGALQDFAAGNDQPAAFLKQENAIETTMQAFLGIAWSLSGFPGKKSIIWATGGMPFTIDSPDAVPGGYLAALYERTMATLNQSNVAIYPVDVRGVVNDMPAADPSRQRIAGNSRANSAMTQVASRSSLNVSSTDALRDFAAMTGGKAGYNNNDIAGLFKRAADDSSSYYLVGYYLDTKNTKPGWRQLKVRLRDKGKDNEVELRARSGFFVTNATMNPDIERKRDLDFAVLSPFDSTGLPVTVRWLGMSVNGANKKVEFGLQLPSNALALGPQNLLNFDYVARVYTNKDGKVGNVLERTIRGNIAQERVTQLQTQGLGFKNELELAPGDYTVRFVVRDDITGRVGSVTAPITVN
ncbi:MAG: VWA domain-containing protein [Terriglobales bacterium]|jgi:VWFA-related protein